MKKNLVILSLLTISTPVYAAAELLTGVPKLACEAILCLSTGSPPGECTPSLSHYFNIDFDDFGDTIRERLNFLNQCPAANYEPQMAALVKAIANGAGRCDAASLNATLVGYPSGFNNRGCISNKKPSYCTIYESHEYTKLGQTVYVVDPPKTNYWPFSNIGNYGQSPTNGFGKQNPQSCGRWVTTAPAP